MNHKERDATGVCACGSKRKAKTGECADCGLYFCDPCNTMHFGDGSLPCSAFKPGASHQPHEPVCRTEYVVGLENALRDVRSLIKALEPKLALGVIDRALAGVPEPERRGVVPGLEEFVRHNPKRKNP